jgi:hypothetical protein
MVADQDRREAGGAARPDCVIAVLPDGQAGLGPAEHRALRVLAEAGLVGHTRNTRPLSPTSKRIRRVKTGARVAEAVETALALH